MLQLQILRQLVELQLTHSPTIKGLIERAWGVVHNKHKRKDVPAVRPDATDPHSQENLQLAPLGQDRNRKRYWISDGSCTIVLLLHFSNPIWVYFAEDHRILILASRFLNLRRSGKRLWHTANFPVSLDSPRIYVSTNPWKITATFQTLSSTREEYLATLEQLKHDAPGALKKGEKRSRSDQAHLALVEALESRIGTIDAEIAVSLSLARLTIPDMPRNCLGYYTCLILPACKPCVRSCHSSK